MATPAQIIPQIEGLVGFQIGSADGGSIQGNQVVADWVQMVKTQLSLSSYRYLTDFEFSLFNDLDEDATGADDEANDATHFCASLIEMVTTIATDAEGWVGYADSDAFTFAAGDTALQDEVFLVVSINDVVTTGVSEFYPIIQLAGGSDDGGYSNAGVALATGLAAGADGNGANAPATDAIRAWVLYRT